VGFVARRLGLRGARAPAVDEQDGAEDWRGYVDDIPRHRRNSRGAVEAVRVRSTTRARASADEAGEPVPSRAHTRGAWGAIRKEEEEGSTGRLPVGFHLAVREDEGKGWRA
jgi:hypothetical protein